MRCPTAWLLGYIIHVHPHATLWRFNNYPLISLSNTTRLPQSLLVGDFTLPFRNKLTSSANETFACKFSSVA